MPAAQVPGSRRRKEQSYRSVISDIFDGSVLSLVQCLTCDRVGALRGGEQSTGLPTQLGAGSLALRPVPPALHLSRGGPWSWGSLCPRNGEQALCPTPVTWQPGFGLETQAGLGRAEPWQVESQADLQPPPPTPRPQVSTTVETFQDLSLPIPGKEDLAKLHSAIYQNVPAKPGTCGDSYAAQGWLAFIVEYIRRCVHLSACWKT